MIEVTFLGKKGEVMYLNPHQIEYIQSKPDTVIMMLSGKKLVVAESYEEIYRRIVEYRREIGAFKNEE
ncbi:flagellar protein FlbD [Thiospirochaeta perfilievii]|uniref:Flagellar protein FlbD n=1 Tax=Thiospirochaeta perfilievii TaxID=252967 RepID=A0A5C1QFU8_9SPIO|nr:flagellar FlbD family protein [Thiospirochaeta perfilievii]QEN06020.1 flagellar protein FlbD [Thiospirochaeta perfilievii]